MREFKFRAWDDNKMYYQVRCGGIFDNIPTAPTTWHENKGDWVNLTGQPYTKIMQYTGLKDKNGKEIYEGDILEFNSVVTWVDGSDPANLGMEVGFYAQRDNFESWRLIEVGEEFDVFINGEYQCLFADTPYNLVQLLEKLGFKNIEKQSYTSRN